MGNILQVTVPNGTAAPVWSSREAGVNSLLFINQDLNNTVWLGQTANVTAGGSNSIPLAPNGTFSGDAGSNWYVTGSAAGIQPLVVVPNGQAYFLGLTQGLGNLAIPSVRSPNFVTGVSGWFIGKNGHAEFNDILIRGGAIVGGSALYYAGTPAANNLVVSSTQAGFVDSFGNQVLPGFTVYGLSGLTYYALNMRTGFTLGNLFGGSFTIYSGASEAVWTARSEMDMADIWQLNSTGFWLRPVGGTNIAITVSNPNALGVQEGWHDMTLLNSWTTTGFAQYKLEPNNRVSIRGKNVVAGTITGGTSIWTPPTGYVPSNTQRVELMIENSTGAAGVLTPRFDILAGGLEVFNIPTGTTQIGFNGSYALD